MTSPTRKTHLFARRDLDRDVFVDKCRQRWLVERAAITLFELAMARLRTDPMTAPLVAELQRFRDEEALHAEMIATLLAEMGHEDPRREPATPEVNIGASEIAVLLELVRGPELTSRHILEVLLMAERLDGGGWELLIDLAKEAELDEDYLRSFRMAGRQEAEHQHVLRAQLERLDHAAMFGAPSTMP